MDKITIGVLLPTSTILPISKDFEKGLKEGLKQEGSDLEIEIVKEFIGQGDPKMVEKACVKFFSYDDVDLVTGVASVKVASGLAERFKNQKKVFLVNDLGAHIPNTNELNEYIFINSPHLWRQAWTLGNWGVKTFGKKGMFIASVYDAGYSFSQMFYEGMKAADKECEWSFSVPPMPPAGELSKMDVIFPFLEQYQPDFIFPVFCGGETAVFLNDFIARGWHHRTQIVATPYLLEPFNAVNADLSVYTATSTLTEPLVHPLKQFHQMGLQSGIAIARAAAASNGTDLREQLAKCSNLFNMAHQLADDEQATIFKHNIVTGQPTYTTATLTQWPTHTLNVEVLKPLMAQLNSGWNNPYLGI